jgi:hypothetical protein
MSRFNMDDRELRDYLDAIELEDELIDLFEVPPLRVLGLDEVRERLLWDRGGAE